MRRAAWQLADLDPAWVDAPCGWGHGVTFDCPRCGPLHRLRVRFINPTDGSTRIHPEATHFRSAGTSFCTLSLVEAIQMAPCFSGWLRNGELLVEEN